MTTPPRLPHRIDPQGLLVGYSLEEEKHKPVMGFAFREAVEDDDGDNWLEPILHTGDGHLISIARTGAGKGVGCIIPALLRYQGPVIVIDPKGENYAVTARRRRELGQTVHLIDPFGVTGDPTGALNPLDLIDPEADDAIDAAAELAELIVTDHSTRDPFWDERALSLVTTMILFIAAQRPPVLRNLQELHFLLNQSKQDLDFTFKEMSKSKLEAVRRGCALYDTADARVFASILSTTQSHTDFLRSTGAKASLGQSTIQLDDITSGTPMSIYIVIPPEKLESHGKLLRMWIGAMMSAITRRRQRPQHPTLFILDEAAQLGTMRQLRQAVTLLRGYGLRTWSFLQDLSQLKHLYPNDWQTMINNCEVLQAFGFANAAVARDGADLTGFSNWRLLQDLEADEMVLAIAGDEAVIARRPNYLTDPAFAGQFDANGFHQMPTNPPAGDETPIRRYVRSGSGQRFLVEPDAPDGRPRLSVRDSQTLRESLALLEYYWKEARPRLETAGPELRPSLILQEPHEAVMTLLREALDTDED